MENELCTPALIYLVLSILGYLGLIYQNLTTKSYCVGEYECDMIEKPLAFVIKFVYIIVWTWVLNLLCNKGYTNVAWFLFLFPFIILILLLLLFVSIGIFK